MEQVWPHPIQPERPLDKRNSNVIPVTPEQQQQFASVAAIFAPTAQTTITSRTTTTNNIKEAICRLLRRPVPSTAARTKNAAQRHFDNFLVTVWRTR
jgi:hypothetical protein